MEGGFAWKVLGICGPAGQTDVLLALLFEQLLRVKGLGEIAVISFRRAIQIQRSF